MMEGGGAMEGGGSGGGRGSSPGLVITCVRSRSCAFVFARARLSSLVRICFHLQVVAFVRGGWLARSHSFVGGHIRS